MLVVVVGSLRSEPVFEPTVLESWFRFEKLFVGAQKIEPRPKWRYLPQY